MTWTLERLLSYAETPHSPLLTLAEIAQIEAQNPGAVDVADDALYSAISFIDGGTLGLEGRFHVRLAGHSTANGVPTETERSFVSITIVRVE